jgi:hypothetical protein
VPAIGVMTQRFVSAAEVMARVLDMRGYKFVVIGHPISSASDARLADYECTTIEQARHLAAILIGLYRWDVGHDAA